MMVLWALTPAYHAENGMVELASPVLAVVPELRKVGSDRLEGLVVEDAWRDETVETTASMPGMSSFGQIKHGCCRATLQDPGF